MKCPKCQCELPDGSKFCNECGAKIVEETNNQPQKKYSSKTTETTIIKCPSLEINNCIAFYEAFGWEYQSNQYAYDSRQVVDGAVMTNRPIFGINVGFVKTVYHTNTTEFAVLTFSRDRNQPHYQELVDLEKKYNAIDQKRPYTKTGGFVFLIVIGAFLSIIGITVMAYGIPEESRIKVGTPILVIGMILLAAGISLTVLMVLTKKKRERIYQENVKKAAKILEQAKSLPDQ